MLMLLSPAICFAEAGVPLGGIGTGKLEIRPDGSFGGITLNNNPNRPIPEMNGTFLSIYVENGERKTTRILSSADMGLDIPPLKPEFIQHKGLWPRARFHYDDPALLVNVALAAFGSVIPRDHKCTCRRIHRIHLGKCQWTSGAKYKSVCYATYHRLFV